MDDNIDCKKYFNANTSLRSDIKDNFVALCEATRPFAYKDSDKLTAKEKNDAIKTILTNLRE